jgi:hypothetical protein
VNEEIVEGSDERIAVKAVVFVVCYYSNFFALRNIENKRDKKRQMWSCAQCILHAASQN